MTCFVVGLTRGGDIHGVLKSAVELARSTHVSCEQRCYHGRREVNGSKRRVRGRPFHGLRIAHIRINSQKERMQLANRDETAVKILKMDVIGEIFHQGRQKTAFFAQGEFSLAALGGSHATPTIRRLSELSPQCTRKRILIT